MAHAFRASLHLIRIVTVGTAWSRPSINYSFAMASSTLIAPHSQCITTKVHASFHSEIITGVWHNLPPNNQLSRANPKRAAVDHCFLLSRSSGMVQGLRALCALPQTRDQVWQTGHLSSPLGARPLQQSQGTPFLAPVVSLKFNLWGPIGLGVLSTL
jgi:hypothetical protein